MTRPHTLSATAYARAIESRWASLVGAPGVLSPRDWACVSDWHARGVLLSLVLESLEVAAEQARRRGGILRSLTAVARGVEEAWLVVREGRLGTAQEQGRPQGPRPAREAWRLRLGAEPAGSPLGARLGEMLSRLDAGESAAQIDEELDRQLPQLVQADLLTEVSEALRRELAPYLSRIAAHEIEATARCATIDRLRQRLGLPRWVVPP